MVGMKGYLRVVCEVRYSRVIPSCNVTYGPL